MTALPTESRVSLFLGWCTTPLYLLWFGGVLLASDLLQRLVSPFSHQIQRRVSQTASRLLVTGLRALCGVRFTASPLPPLPFQGPVVVVMNHQSLFDIPFLICCLSGRHVRFISKKELGRFLPGVSFPLRTLGHLLIDRSDRRGATATIAEFGRELWDSGSSDAICIFPEGTRARDGVMKPFKASGLRALLEGMPDAAVLPVAIHGSWRLMRFRFLPIPFGVPVHLQFLEVRGAASLTTSEAVGRLEELITQTQHELSGGVDPTGDRII